MGCTGESKELTKSYEFQEKNNEKIEESMAIDNKEMTEDLNKNDNNDVRYLKYEEDIVNFKEASIDFGAKLKDQKDIVFYSRQNPDDIESDDDIELPVIIKASDPIPADAVVPDVKIGPKGTPEDKKPPNSEQLKDKKEKNDDDLFEKLINIDYN